MKEEVNKQFRNFYLIWDFCVERSQGGTVSPYGHIVTEVQTEGMWAEADQVYSAHLLLRYCEAISSLFT